MLVRKMSMGLAAGHMPCAIRIESGAAGQAVVCVAPIAAGSVIFALDGEVVAAAGRHTIQIDAARHLDPGDRDWRLTNHACEPNAHADLTAGVLRARRDIAPGEQVTFDYDTTEWDMAAPFACVCGAANCRGEVRGFRYLAAAERQAIAGWLSPFLAARLRAAEAGGS